MTVTSLAVVVGLCLYLQYCSGLPQFRPLLVPVEGGRPLALVVTPPDNREDFSPSLVPTFRARQHRLYDEPTVSSSQGPEGFAYEISHPVLDEYGKLRTATQYHGQDGLGRYRYSYKHPGSRREEYVDENGRVQGSYSYKSDDEDKISMSYVADDTGFHVKRAVLPPLASRAPRDDPLVAAIKAAHIQLWRKMWIQAAMASMGQNITDAELQQIIATEAPPTPTSEADVPASPPEGLDAAVVDSTANGGPATDEPLTPTAPEPIVPVFPGAPDAPAVPVGSAPKPLSEGVPGLNSPDEETIVVDAKRADDGEAVYGRSEGDFNVPRGRSAQLEFETRPVGALRFRDNPRFISEPQQFIELGLDPQQAEVFSTVVNTGHDSAVIQARTAQSDILSFRSAAHPRGAGPQQGHVQLRVSDEAARLGGVPVAARHDRAQIRPSQLPGGDDKPVLDDPLLYYYSNLLHDTQQPAKTPEMIVV